jgi:hypothetical protein
VLFFRKVTEHEINEAYHYGYNGAAPYYEQCPYWRPTLIKAWYAGMKDWFHPRQKYDWFRDHGMGEEDLSRLKADWEALTA